MLDEIAPERNLISESTPGLGTKTYTYQKGRKVSATDYNGNKTTFTYDTYGNVWKVTDAYGNIVEENTYDAIDQLIKAEDGVGSIATYSYDKSVNITKAVMAAGTENESSYVYSYDKMGRILTSTDPLSGRSSYTYNAQGLLAEETNARAQNTEYTYDALGRITEIKDEIGTIRYTYDANGNILTVSEQQGLLETKEITRTYDCMNRVTSYTDYNGKTIEYATRIKRRRICLSNPDENS